MLQILHVVLRSKYILCVSKLDGFDLSRTWGIQSPIVYFLNLS